MPVDFSIEFKHLHQHSLYWCWTLLAFINDLINIVGWGWDVWQSITLILYLIVVFINEYLAWMLNVKLIWSTKCSVLKEICLKKYDFITAQTAQFVPLWVVRCRNWEGIDFASQRLTVRVKKMIINFASVSRLKDYLCFHLYKHLLGLRDDS